MPRKKHVAAARLVTGIVWRHQKHSRPMIMKVANDPDPPRPLGFSYVLNIDAFLGSIVIGVRAQVSFRDSTPLCGGVPSLG